MNFDLICIGIGIDDNRRLFLYNPIMNYFTTVSKIFNFKSIDNIMVSNLYALSQKSIIALVAFSILLTYYLYPSLSYSIVLWEVMVILLTIARLYLANIFHKYQTKYTMKTWYKLFLLSALLTAILLSLLGFIAIFYVQEAEQIFIIASLIGITSGAMSSLFPDIRIVIAYISVIIIPLIIALISLNTSTGIILSMLVILYYAAQLVIILNTHKQNSDLEEKKEEIFIEKEKLYKEKENIQHFFEQAPLAIFTYDLELKVTDCNKEFLTLFGLKKEEILNKSLNTIPDKRPILAIENALVHGTQTYVGPYVSLKNLEYWVEAKYFPIYDDRSKVTGATGIIENKTKEHNAVNELKLLAHHDPLTNLLNRRGFMEYMERLVEDERHEKHYSLLFYMDLNQFKGINDSLGHTVGDEVLLKVAQRLTHSLDDACTISRLGGDEFIIIVPYISDNKSNLDDTTKEYEQKVIGIFTNPFIIEDLHLRLSASIGMIIVEPNYVNIDEIIRHADITMYQAKGSNAKIAYYNEALDKQQKNVFKLQHDLAYAVERNQFDMFFQPIVTMADDKLCAAEALIRWEHPTRGLLSPVEFIPLAIKVGLLSQITWWVLENVCDNIAKWKKENCWHLEYVSINVNAQQLVENNFAIEFLKKLEDKGLETQDIMIEITERSLIDNFDSTQEVINVLRNKGVKCAIDDFGTGYSSLSYLKKLSFNTLKIDREFVQDIESNAKELLLVSTILDIGRQFDYTIVIEGIEDKKQKELLLGLDENLRYQGFYFSKPLHSEAFRKKFLI